MNDLNNFLIYAKRINEKWQALSNDEKERYYMDGLLTLFDEDEECLQLLNMLPEDLLTIATELIINGLDIRY
jgi:hypothetical protein